MATSAERQKLYRKAMKERGMVPVTAYVPERLQGDFMQIARLLTQNPDLEIAMLRNTKTGRLQKV